MGILDKLQPALKSAENHLWSNYHQDGKIHGPCSSRPIETALTIHLVQGMPFLNEYSERLLSYCIPSFQEQSLHGSSKNQTDKQITDLIIFGVLRDRMGMNPSKSLVDALQLYEHPSKKRKYVLFSVLLAEVGLISFESLAFTQDSFEYAHSQSWTKLMMTAAKVIYGLSPKSPFCVSDKDLSLLVKSQSENGSWDYHLFASLVILIALKKTKRFTSHVTRGITFIQKQTRCDGGVPLSPT